MPCHASLFVGISDRVEDKIRAEVTLFLVGPFCSAPLLCGGVFFKGSQDAGQYPEQV